jgi:hypothetical protein
VEAAGWFGRLRLGERSALSTWIDLADDTLRLPCLPALAVAAGYEMPVAARVRSSLVKRGLIEADDARRCCVLAVPTLDHQTTGATR